MTAAPNLGLSPAEAKTLFNTLDLNGDGVIDRSEFDNVSSLPSSLSIQISGIKAFFEFNTNEIDFSSLPRGGDYSSNAASGNAPLAETWSTNAISFAALPRGGNSDSSAGNDSASAESVSAWRTTVMDGLRESNPALRPLLSGEFQP